MEFLSDQSAKIANKAIKSSLKTMNHAKQCSVLWFEDINERKLYRELGYSSINQYAKQELGFSSSRTGDYLQLCRYFKKLPKVKEKVKSGDLGYTAARVLATVANEKNQDQWLDLALNNSRRVLEREVKRAKQEAADDAVGQGSLLPVQARVRPAAVIPVNVRMEMTPTQFARYEALWAQVRKQGRASTDKVEALLEILGEYVAEKTPRGEHLADGKPPVQMHVHHCPECEKATVQTSKGELGISEGELQRAEGDCQISKPGQRNTTSIPPATRRFILARARHRCERPGCVHTQFLEVHHKVTRVRGGSNDSENLMVVCSACHALLHRQSSAKLGFMVKSPEGHYNLISHNSGNPIIYWSEAAPHYGKDQTGSPLI